MNQSTLATKRNLAFSWKDHSRFVEVAPVSSGWLTLWGRYHDMGRGRELVGNQIYLDLRGVRRRLADAVFELTHDQALVAEAIVLFDRAALTERRFPTQ